MHFLTYVLVPGSTKNVEKAVAKALAPFQEGELDSRGWWDWYQIGGRWSGCLSEYDPEKDPKNIEKCDLCEGTGVRDDRVGVANGFPTMTLKPEVAKSVGRTVGYCNGCGGLGKRTKWPTQWDTHRGDIQCPSVALTKDMPYRVVLASGEVLHSENFVPSRKVGGGKFVKTKDYNKIVKAELKKAAAAGQLVVVVDCHN